MVLLEVALQPHREVRDHRGARRGEGPALEPGLIHRTPPFDVGREARYERSDLVQPRLTGERNALPGLRRHRERDRDLHAARGASRCVRLPDPGLHLGEVAGSASRSHAAIRRNDVGASSSKLALSDRCGIWKSSEMPQPSGPTSADEDAGSSAKAARARARAGATRAQRARRGTKSTHVLMELEECKRYARPMSEARVLVVANRTAESPELLDALRKRTMQGPCAFTLVIPSTPHGIGWAADMHGGGEEAEQPPRRVRRGAARGGPERG